MAEGGWLGPWLAVEAVAVVVAETLGRDNVRQPGLEFLKDLLLLVGPGSIKETFDHLFGPVGARAVLLLTLRMECQL